MENRFGIADYGCREGACATLLLQGIDRGEIEALPEEPEILRFLYGEGVATVDRELGRLFAGLEELGLFEDLLIVLTSDHGELLLEHAGALLHGKTFEEVVQVPLLIKWPGGAHAGETVTVPSSALDVAPTLLAHLRLTDASLPGHDLAASPNERPIFSGGLERMVRIGRWKAVIGPERTGLFNLTDDPEERIDLRLDRSEKWEELSALLERRWARDDALQRSLGSGNEGREVLLNDAEKKRLRALGYLGEYEPNRE